MGFLPFQPMELVFSQRAESNRNESADAQNRVRRTAGPAAGLIQIQRGLALLAEKSSSASSHRNDPSAGSSS
jgi:hypothetical protein